MFDRSNVEKYFTFFLQRNITDKRKFQQITDILFTDENIQYHLISKLMTDPENFKQVLIYLQQLLMQYLLKLGTSWNKLEIPKTNRNQVEQGGTNWKEMDLATIWDKRREIPRKKLCVQYQCPTESNFSKQHHLRCGLN